MRPRRHLLSQNLFVLLLVVFQGVWLAPFPCAAAAAVATPSSTAEGHVQQAAAPGAAVSQPDTSSKALLGVAYVSSYSTPGFPEAQQRISDVYNIGFRLVSLVPTWPYVGLNRIDFNKGVPLGNLADTLFIALQKHMRITLKPHLDPQAFTAGYSQFWRESHSWRDDCPWRGYFDVDPMSPDYRDGVLGTCFTAIQQALSRLPPGQPPPPPIRLELGTELMDSVVAFPDKWVELLAWARGRRAELGLDARVALSHNFAHHIEIPEDEVLRMTDLGRAALGEYISGLDALALSQYMDLSIAQDKAARDARAVPSALDVARSLARHDRNFRADVLQGILKIAPDKIPTIHIGEFGIGTGGLRHPNTWGGDPTGEEAKFLDGQMVRGYEGLAVYLGNATVSAEEGVPRAPTASLWITGPRFDVWGWEQQKYANPAAQVVAKGYLADAAKQ